MKVLALVTLFLLGIVLAQNNTMNTTMNSTTPAIGASSPGSFSELTTLTSNDTTKINLFKSYKNQIGLTMNSEFTTKFEPVSYSQQVVNGMNYKIKYDIGDNKFIVVQVYQPLPNSNEMPKVTGVLDDGDGNSIIINHDEDKFMGGDSNTDDTKTAAGAMSSEWTKLGADNTDLWRLFNSW